MIQTELKRINYALNKAARAKLREKLNIMGLTARNQGLKPKLTKEPRVYGAKGTAKDDSRKNWKDQGPK
jgi:hypothetical protein